MIQLSAKTNEKIFRAMINSYTAWVAVMLLSLVLLILVLPYHVVKACFDKELGFKGYMEEVWGAAKLCWKLTWDNPHTNPEFF
jgi:hypothetical protein